MARLTIEGVKTYAAECGYELVKGKSNGYVVNGVTGFFNLNDVITAIKEGELLSGQSSSLPDNQAIAQQELEQYINEQAVLIRIEECSYCQSTFLMDSGEDDHVQCGDCGEKQELYVEAQAEVKCVYPNCEQPCSRDCDSALKCNCGDVFTDAVEFIVHDCEPQPTPENTSIYIDEIVPSPLGGYEVITAPPQTQRYEVPLLEKCLEIEPEPTLADVIREYNDLPIFVAHLPRTSSIDEVREIIVLLGRFAHGQILTKGGDRQLLLDIQRCVGNIKTICNDVTKIKAMHRIVCIYRDFRKTRQKV